MAVLVTGGAGFIGSEIVRMLLARGERVVVVDDFNDYYDPLWKRNNLPARHDLLKVIELDIRSPHFIDIFKDNPVDAVIHLAARAGVRPSLAHPQLYFDVNVMGTVNVLEAVRQAHVAKLIFASSSSVYGNRSDGPFKETDNTDRQVSPYGVSKKSAELICQTYARLYQIQTTVCRFFTVYGPHNRPDLACYRFMDRIAHHEPIEQYGNGMTGRDYTYVSDTAAGVVAALSANWNFEIINLGNSHPILLKDMIRMIAQMTGNEPKIIIKPSQAGDVEFTCADISKAKQFLNWEPVVPFNVGVQKLWEWYKENL